MNHLQAAFVAAGIVCFGHAQSATLLVNKTADDGSAHTLRWAILENNKDPRDNRILIAPTGASGDEWVIRVNTLLPAIVGPATIEGLRRGRRDAPDVVIDGSNVVDVTTTASCPAENGNGSGPNVRSLQKPALAVVDSGGVDISGLEIRNFCIGIMLLRSHDNRIHHNVIHDMVGAAGIMVTGDAGDAAGSATTGLSTNNLIEYNVVYDTGDGGECTRGSTNLTYRYNHFFQSSPNTVSPRSQGVECAGPGNDNIRFIGNMFSGYSDGLQLNQATNVLVEGNTITASTYGITSSGTALIRDNTIAGNRMGVGPTNTARVTITANRIYDNGRPILSLPTSAGGTTNPASPALLGIDVGVNGVTPNDLAASCADGFPDCNTIQNFPVLLPSSTWNSGGVTLRGTLASRPNATFNVDFYASHGLNQAGFAEGERYLGSLAVTTDGTGNATFQFAVATTDALGDGSASAIFTSTATNANGATSEFSAGLPLAR